MGRGNQFDPNIATIGYCTTVPYNVYNFITLPIFDFRSYSCTICRANTIAMFCRSSSMVVMAWVTLFALFSSVSCLSLSMNKNGVLVIGGTGRIGRNVVPKLLKKGYDVKVLVRSKEKAFFIKELKGAKLVEGDVTNMDSLVNACEGCGTIIDVHGMSPSRFTKPWDLFVHPKNLGYHPYNVNYQGVKKILAAMAINRCTKLVRITGSLVDKPAFKWVRVLFNVLLSFTGKWHEASEIAIRRSGLDYTVIRPTGIQSMPSAAASSNRSLILLPGDSSALPPIPGAISVEDVGELVVRSVSSLPKSSVVCSSVVNKVDKEGVLTPTGPKTWDGLLENMPADTRTIKIRPHKLAASVYITAFSVVMASIAKVLFSLVQRAVRLVLK